VCIAFFADSDPSRAAAPLVRGRLPRSSSGSVHGLRLYPSPCIQFRRICSAHAAHAARSIAATWRETSALDPARPLLDPTRPPTSGRPPATLACVTARTLTFMIQIWQHFIQMPPLTPTCPVPTTVSPILVMIILSDTQFNRRIPQYRQHPRCKLSCSTGGTNPLVFRVGPPNQNGSATAH
jgi:hypothetical protein